MRNVAGLPFVRVLGAVMLLVSAPLLASCSVGMAAAGKPGPNLAVCDVGTSRLEIERELGAPKAVRTTEDGGTSCTYEYELGNEPSAGRAVLHAGMDVLTGGLWELVGTPVEALQGKTYEMVVVYGPDGNAKEITSRPVK